MFQYTVVYYKYTLFVKKFIHIEDIECIIISPGTFVAPNMTGTVSHHSFLVRYTRNMFVTNTCIWTSLMWLIMAQAIATQTSMYTAGYASIKKLVSKLNLVRNNVHSYQSLGAGLNLSWHGWTCQGLMSQPRVASWPDRRDSSRTCISTITLTF